jgi:drug/metabolite transporter (DMT)-like permease
MILFLSGKNVSLNIILALLGVFLIYNEKEQIKKESMKNSEVFEKNEQKEWFPNEKWLMIFLAALTEAMIYFVVRNIKTENSWNHVFLSYFFGFILLSVLLWGDLSSILQMEFWKKETQPFYASIGINAGIGLFGYLLRFFAMYRLEPVIYSVLSYFGVLMAFVYGVLFNGNTPSIKEIIGSLCILGSTISYWFF